MKILVTGATGFLGQEIVSRLIPEHQVVGLARQVLESEADGVTWLRGDVLVPESLEPALEGVDNG